MENLGEWLQFLETFLHPNPSSLTSLADALLPAPPLRSLLPPAAVGTAITPSARSGTAARYSSYKMVRAIVLARRGGEGVSCACALGTWCRRS